MTEESRTEGTHSLTPIELEVSSLDTEAAAMSRGKGITLAGFASGGVIVTALVLLALGHLDQRQVYLDAGMRVETLRREGIQRFWNCVLVGANPSMLRTADDVESQINQRAEHFGPIYGAHLKRCGTGLVSAERELDALVVPVPLAASVDAMQQGVLMARQALGELTSRLADDEQYDSPTTKLHVAKLALSWDELRRSHATFRAALRKQLGDHRGL
jgi:hypothetical protein